MYRFLWQEKLPVEHSFTFMDWTFHPQEIVHIAQFISTIP